LVLSFVSIVEYFVTNRYLEKDKINVAIVLLEEKACVLFDMFTTNYESECPTKKRHLSVVEVDGADEDVQETSKELYHGKF
jgi:hypothetical protein